MLRLPYSAITDVIGNLFSEQISEACIVNFVDHISDAYAGTEKALLRRILASPFVHVDETKFSIHRAQNYVWVLTDGSHVVFRLTETRETTLIRELLNGYDGVLVSDFYGGYDSVRCRQQKCLVHLIGDLNDDLWKNPFNEEVEQFVGAVRDLLVPIFEDVERYGLKARHLSKHRRTVDRFYRDRIDVGAASCEVVAKYQKRLQRYAESLFLFLQEDGIPWNNNTAERAIRHLAIQRKISGSFCRPIAVQYLACWGSPRHAASRTSRSCGFFCLKRRMWTITGNANVRRRHGSSSGSEKIKATTEFSDERDAFVSARTPSELGFAASCRPILLDMDFCGTALDRRLGVRCSPLSPAVPVSRVRSVLSLDRPSVASPGPQQTTGTMSR